MDGIDVLRYQVKDTYAWLEMTVSDVTEEQANWQPPGVANSIGAVYAHTIIGADVAFNSMLHHGMPLIARDFSGQVGLSEPHLGGMEWAEWASRLRVDWARFREYAQAVQMCVEDYADALTIEELKRTSDMTAQAEHLGTWNGFEFYNVHGINHPRLHGGEIACLKGMQGASGWQEGWRPPIERPI